MNVSYQELSCDLTEKEEKKLQALCQAYKEAMQDICDEIEKI